MSNKPDNSNDDTVRLLRPPPRVFTNIVGQNIWLGEVEPLELELENAQQCFDPYNSEIAESSLRISSSP